NPERGNRLRAVAEGEPAALPEVVSEVEVIDQDPRARRARHAVAARRDQGRGPAGPCPPEGAFARSPEAQGPGPGHHLARSEPAGHPFRQGATSCRAKANPWPANRTASAARTPLLMA